MPSSHPDFPQKFDNDGNGLGCEVINSEVTDGFSSTALRGHPASGGLITKATPPLRAATLRRAQRSSPLLTLVLLTPSLKRRNNGDKGF